MLSALIDLREKKVLIVGGGKVALRKAKFLLDQGAIVCVLSKEFNESFWDFKDKISLVKENYNKKYLEGRFLVVAATDDHNINKEICRDAKDLNILCNSVDKSSDSSMMFQSSMKRGKLQVSVSTGGSFAGLSKKIKNELEDDYGDYVKYLASKRDEIIAAKGANNRDDILALLELTYRDYKKLNK